MLPEIKENISLAPHTFYKIGGPAKFFIKVKNLDELKKAVQLTKTKSLPFFILGAGSNILVSDRGFLGAAIHIVSSKIQVQDEHIILDAGVMMARGVVAAARAGLSGFEWGIGIPGTIGGSLRGNAGCFGGEMKDIIVSVEVIQTASHKWQKKTLNNAECKFGYRDSVFKSNPDWIILSATLKLKKGNPDFIQDAIRQITKERTTKQAIGTKSCGCIFKNVSWTRKDVQKEKILFRFPELRQFQNKPNIPASFLIDGAYLKGRRVGDVFVSPKHANYFVNDGRASAEDVVILIALVKDTVKRKFGILLEEEIQYVGF